MKSGVLSLMILILATGCENPVEPSIPSDIVRFVEDLQLEKQQDIEIIGKIEKEDIYFFRILYGNSAHWMPGSSCCYYPRFYGLKNGEKIYNIDDYIIDSRDEYLFTKECFQIVKPIIDDIYFHKFLPLLAADEDTPVSALTAIAEELYDYIYTHIAWDLLENPVVQNNVEILTLLANLPVFQGDSYELVREQASNLLDKLNS